jgi:hypothetical protein
MSEERDRITALVHPEARGDFLAERKRLREARMKWIDEHEMPVAMEVRDAAGNAVSTPFQVGRMTYGADYDKAAEGHKDARKGFIPSEMPPECIAVAKQLEEVIKQYNQFSGIAVRDGNGDEVSFSAKSDHPPIEEGESHEDWFTRVSNSYSKAAANTADAGSAGADIDGVRKPAGDDSSDRRQIPYIGAEVRRDAPANLDSLSVANIPVRSTRDDVTGDDVQRKSSAERSTGDVTAGPASETGDA